MDSTRSSGILLHVSSLAGPHGIGDFGREAYEFVDALARARQGIWQVLPLGPTGYGDSPYQSFSAFAGNPLFVSLRELAAHGWIEEAVLPAAPPFADERLDFEAVIPWRLSLLRQAFARFQDLATSDQAEDLTAFRSESRDWLEDYALFMALKNHHASVAWNRWPAELVSRSSSALDSWRERLAGD